eukprot:IDg2910t1
MLSPLGSSSASALASKAAYAWFGTFFVLRGVRLSVDSELGVEDGVEVPPGLLLCDHPEIFVRASQCRGYL